MKMSSCAFACGWPTYSASRRGRMALSTASSSRVASTAIVLSACKMDLLRRRALQGAADQLFGGMCTRTGRLEQARRLRRLVAQSHQRAEGLGLGTRPRGHGARRVGARRLETVAHLDEQALRGLAADPRHLDERGHILALHAERERLDTQSREQRQGDLGADARYLDQAAKETPLVLGAERVEDMRILAYHQMGEQPHLFANRRQMEESRHGRLELIAEASGLHQQLRRSLRDDAPPYRPDHRETTSAARVGAAERCSNSSRRRECAWQRATASASAASGAIRPWSPRSVRIMCATWTFSAAPEPTTASLIARGAYSKTGRPFGTAHSAAPRAWPSFSALSTFRLTNTRSMATSPGACAAMSSRRLSKMTRRRSGSDSAAPATVTHPCAACTQSAPRRSMRP